MTENASATDGTDAFFGFLVGLYAAALVAPVISMGVALRVTDDPAVLYLTLLGSATLVIAGVGLVARRESLAVRLGATRWKWLAVVVPFAHLTGLFVGAVTKSDPPVVGWLAFPGAIMGMLVGLGLVVAARNRYSKAVLAGAEEYVRLTARGPERDRRIAKAGAAAAAFVLGIAGFLAAVVFDYAPFRWIANVLVPMAAGFVGATDERTLTVTDDGLVVKRALNRSVRPWSAYESYSVSEDALVVHRAGWSAWGVRDVRCDARDVEDVDDVETALATFLPRRRA